MQIQTLTPINEREQICARSIEFERGKYLCSQAILIHVNFYFSFMCLVIRSNGILGSGRVHLDCRLRNDNIRESFSLHLGRLLFACFSQRSPFKIHFINSFGSLHISCVLTRFIRDTLFSAFHFLRRFGWLFAIAQNDIL